MGNKIGRNDPCPCGSGRKYKKCCQPKDEAARASELVRFTGMTEGDLDAFFDVPETCWVCGKPVNPFGMFSPDGDTEPDGVTINLGARKVTVHGACMPEAQRRLSSKPAHQTPKGEFGEWTWCVHCERVHRTEKWVANDWKCPGPDCDGSLVDAHDFQNPQGWPTVSYLSGEDPYRYVYLENPTDGGYYPLYPHWKNGDELLKIGTRGRWVDRTWVPEHPIEHRRIELPDGRWVEGSMQLRQCQVCGQEAYCAVHGCWDCHKIYCVNCDDGFGKCLACGSPDTLPGSH